MTLAPGNRPQTRPSESPVAHPDVQRQLAQLFGESLFGAWPQLSNVSVSTTPRRRRKAKFLKWIVLAIAMTIGLVVTRAARHGMAHRSNSQRDRYADELKVFLGDGNLERVAQYVPLVQGGSSEAQRVSEQAHLDLLIWAEAALFRYFDASPSRLLKLRPYIEDGARSTPHRELAHLVTLSREERALQLATIERLKSALPEPSGLDYLRATALEFSGEIESSRKAWQRSADLEPAWFGHRFEQAWFETRQHETDRARKLALQIARADESGWARLAADVFSLPVSAEPHEGKALASTPVQTYFELLFRSFAAARSDHLDSAKQLLEQSAAVVNYQSPFLLDAFDWCLAEHQTALAKALTDLPAWPKSTPVAAAKQQRLSRLP